MTPQFTTPCYVQVDDKDKRKEVCEKLEEMGYKSTLSVEHNSWGNLIVVRRYGVIQNTGSTYGELPTHLINCSTDIDLFLTLAGMREDTDKGQYFTTKGSEYRTESWHQCHSEQMYGDKLGGEYRRATAAEIIEHFKTKENANKPTIAVWFSCGAASAVAAKLTLEKYGETHNIMLVNNPIAEEHSDNRWRNVEEELPRCGEDFIGKMDREYPFKDEVEFTSTFVMYKRTSDVDADCLDKLHRDGCTHWKSITE